MMKKCCVCGDYASEDYVFVPDENRPEYVFCDSCYRSFRRLAQNPDEKEYQRIDALFAEFARNVQIPQSVRDVYRKADDAYWHNKELASKYNDTYSRAIDNLLLTTGSTFDGFKVVKYLDIISCEIIFKNSFIKLLEASMDDFVNLLSLREKEMTGSMELIEHAKNHVMTQFKKKAVDLGANAVLSIDFETTLGSDIVKVSVNGTAVVVDALEQG